MMDAKRLGAAFRAGMAFSFGRKHRLGMLAQDEAKWITVHPNGKGMTKGGDKAKGQPVLIEGSTGEILGGMGGKFNGRHISAVPKRGKKEQHMAQQAIEFYKNREQIEAERKAKEQQKANSVAAKPYFVDNAQRLVNLRKATLESFDLEKKKQEYIAKGGSPRLAVIDAQRVKEWLEKDLKQAQNQLEKAPKEDAELAQLIGELRNAEFDKEGKNIKKYERFLSSVKKLEKYDLNKEADKDQKKYGSTREEAEEAAYNNRVHLARNILIVARDLKEGLKDEKKQKEQEERETLSIRKLNEKRNFSSSELGKKTSQVFDKHKGNITEDAAQEAGTLALDGLTKLPILSKLNSIQSELDSTVQERNDAYSSIHFDTPTEARLEAKKKVSALLEKEKEIRSRIDSVRSESAKAVTDYIATIRPINDLPDERMIEGFADGRSTDVNKTLIAAQRCFPKEWAEAFLNRGKVVTKRVQRGYFLDGISGSDTVAISGSGSEALRCALHELGHRLEVTNPLVRRLEKEFYKRRTVNEKLASLRKLTGNSSYSTKEKTRKDNFLNLYMGKDYGGSAYELVSMGLEMLYTEPHKLLKDPDYAKFILGVVALT